MTPSSGGSGGPQRLRILYPASLTVGGAERQMLLLAERLPRERFDVSFVMLGAWTPNADLALAAGAHVHALGAHGRRRLSRPRLAVHASRVVLDYVRLCRRERFDIVDAWLYHGYAVAGVTRPLTRVPVLISGRVSLSGYKQAFGPLERVADAIARRQSDLIFANAEAVADDVAAREGIDRASIRIIRNGVLIPDPMPADERRTRRAGWGAADDDLVVGYVGSMRPGKGHARIVAAMPDLIRQVPKARLVLVGGGPERPVIERRIAELGVGDRVTLTGDVVDARPLFGALDLFVSASMAEGLPNSVLEAAAAGIPIVTTAAGGTVEIVEDGRTGLVVPVDDDAGLRVALTRLASDAPLRLRLGSAARDHVAAAFGVDRFVRETADLYEEMARRRGVGGYPRPARIR
ncbi:MAG: glycosyltransferase [Chloroflexota bacterium]